MITKLNGTNIAEPELFEVGFQDIHAEGTGRNEAGKALIIILRAGVRQFEAKWTAITTAQKNIILQNLNSNTYPEKALTYYDPELGGVTKNFYTDNLKVSDYGNGLWDISCGFTEV